jgi:hypothetical protein
MSKSEKTASHTSAGRTTRRRGSRKARPALSAVTADEPGSSVAAALLDEPAPAQEVLPGIADLPAPPPPEIAFAARIPPPEPERPRPTHRRAVFFDVENTSRSADVKRMLEQLRIDRFARATDLVASGNWRVIGHESARILASHGFHLVHSAPATGVRDWSDLRIAVAAGVWLASARPGDELDIVSDDRAFDVLGDAAAALGVTFQRLSFRGAKGASRRTSAGPRERPAPRREASDAGASTPAPVITADVAQPEQLHPPTGASDSPPTEIPQSARDEQLLTVVQELLAMSPAGVTLDAVGHRLRELGFQRPPGSPRLVTRLRALRELDVSPRGSIRLRTSPAGADAQSAAPAKSTRRRRGGRGRRRTAAPS